MVVFCVLIFVIGVSGCVVTTDNAAGRKHLHNPIEAIKQVEAI